MAFSRLALLLLAACFASRAAELKPETSGAFDRYARNAEARIAAQTRSAPGFLWADTSERRDRLRRGDIPCESRLPRRELKAPGGLIHDWTAAVFLPGTRLDSVLARLQDYNNHKNVFTPEVIDSRLLERHGGDFRVFLRLLKKKVVTVVLNTEHDVRYQQMGPARWQSRSVSTRVAEVHGAGTPGERELPPGSGHGYLWRLNSYWTFQERDGGTYIECEAISLTRDVPKSLSWLIDPIVRSLPRESLVNTLRSARTAMRNQPAAGRTETGR